VVNWTLGWVLDFDEDLAVWTLVPEGAGKRPVGTGLSMLSSMKRADAGPAPLLMSERSVLEVKRKQTHCSHFRHDESLIGVDHEVESAEVRRGESADIERVR
jgi:hypothetical protein